ncbi:hypothetical protein CRG98_037322, partial [Punica granatum]
FLLRKFAEPARSCLLQPCRVCSPLRVYFSASQVRGAISIVPIATLPGLLTGTPSLLACASYNLAGSAHPCEFTFLLRKFAEPARLCLIKSCRVCSPVRVYFSASQFRRVCSLVTLATLPGLLTCASLLFGCTSSPSLLARATCNLTGSAHLCEFTFTLRKFAEPSRSCLLQPGRVCSPVRVYFSASQIRRACSLVPLATWPGLLTRPSLLFCVANSPSLLARASCNLAGSAHPSEFTFLLRKFAEPARSCLLQPCRVCSPVRRACSLVPHTTLPGLLSCASLLFSFASSPSLLAHAYCNLSGSAHPCEFTFSLRTFAEPARSCILPPCRVCSPMRVYFSASQIRRDYSLVPHTILPGLLTRASLLFYFASSPSMLARASCNLAGSAHLCKFTSLLRKFAEPARLCLIQSCRVCSPVQVYFSASQVRRACSLVPLATWPGLLTPACILFYFASSLSHLHRASCSLTGSAHPCEFTFLLPKFAESARSCLLRPCLICSPVRVYFSAMQVRRACSFVPLANLLDLLTSASLIFRFASSPSLLARTPRLLASASYNLAAPARSCLLRPCLVCSPVRVYFSAMQVRRACSFVPLANLLDLLTSASLIFRFASSPSLLACASYILAGSAHPCEFTFLLRKFADPARPLATLPGLLTRASLLFCFANSPSLLAGATYNLAGSAHPCVFIFPPCKFAELAPLCLIQSYRDSSPVRVYFSASQVRRACSLVPHTILPGQLTRASLLFRFASSPSLLPCASYNLAGSAHPCVFIFPPCKFAELAPLCLIQSYRDSSPVRVYFFCFASSPSLLARASCNLAWFANPCEFTFQHRKFAEPPRSCLLQHCLVCSPVRVYFSASQVRRVCSLVPLATLPGLLTRASLHFCFAGTPSLLACASYNLAGSAHPCEFTFLRRKFAEPARSCLLQPCRVCSPFAEPARSCILQPRRVCSPVRVYFSASQVRRACSLVHPATSPGLLTRASLLFCFASSPSLLARASCNLAGSAHPCEFTFLLRKFAEPARLCLIKSCRVCSPVRVYFSASQIRRPCSASCNLAGSAHPCLYIFLLRKFAEPSPSCLLQPYR